MPFTLEQAARLISATARHHQDGEYLIPGYALKALDEACGIEQQWKPNERKAVCIILGLPIPE